MPWSTLLADIPLGEVARAPLLDPDEERALQGQMQDPYTWACAVGRLLRAGALAPSLKRELEGRLGRVDEVGQIHRVRIRCKLDGEQIHRVLDAIGTGAEAIDEEGDVWRLVEARDDLESVAHALGAIRDAGGDAGAFAASVARAETLLLEELTAIDERATAGEDSILAALRENPFDEIRDRVLAVTTDVTAGYWIAWLVTPWLGLRWSDEQHPPGWPDEKSLGKLLSLRVPSEREARAAGQSALLPMLEVGMPGGDVCQVQLLTRPFIDALGYFRLTIDATELRRLNPPGRLKVSIRLDGQIVKSIETDVTPPDAPGPAKIRMLVEDLYDGGEQPLDSDELVVNFEPRAR